VGLAVGHLDARPRLISLPVSMPDAGVRARRRSVAAETDPGSRRKLRHPADVRVRAFKATIFLPSPHTVSLMERRGFQMADPRPPALTARSGAPGAMAAPSSPNRYTTRCLRPRSLGFTWVTLDDGWQNNYGDWELDPKKFPHGEADIKALVERIHAEGFRAQLWWSPLSAVADSRLLQRAS
jgi:alpha-galactosidase